ncbi:MAG: hypothetical protein Q9P14_07950 [candidate division KSB1 bacterium]|nr:hypothetical protein [candidate division KSB1 bacterium]
MRSFILRRINRRHGLLDFAPQLGPLFLDHFFENGLFAFKIIINAGLAHSGLPGNVLDGGFSQPEPAEQVLGDLDDDFFAIDFVEIDH